MSDAMADMIARQHKTIEGQGLSMQAMAAELREARAEIARVIEQAQRQARAAAIEEVVVWIETHVTAPRLGELPARLRALAEPKV